MFVILTVATDSDGDVKSYNSSFGLSVSFGDDLHGGISFVLDVEIVESL